MLFKLNIQLLNIFITSLQKHLHVNILILMRTSHFSSFLLRRGATQKNQYQIKIINFLSVQNTLPPSPDLPKRD